MVKRILHKYKYPPDLQEAAVELVLQQAQVRGDSWAFVLAETLVLDEMGPFKLCWQ